MSDQAPDGANAGHMVYRAPTHLLQRMGRLVRKEVSTILRDRRTIITLVLMPLLLYPLLTIAFRQFLLASSLKETKEVSYRIGFRSAREGQLVETQIKRGKQALAELRERQSRQRGGSQSPKDAPARGGADAEKPPPSHQLLSPGQGEPAPDLRELLRANQIDLGIHLTEQIPAVGAPGRDHWYVCEILYLEDSPRGRDAKDYVEQYLAAANTESLQMRLRAQPMPRQQPVTLVSLLPESVTEPKSKETIPLSALVPLILILMTITGAVYPAIDLTAGERERGTLEILVAAPIPRLGLLFAKYLSVVTVAVLTAVVNLTTMTVTLLVSGMGSLVFPEGMRAVAVVQVFLLLLLFAAFFSAVLLAVTSFARSFKEAQAYLIPLMLVSLTPGMLSLMPELDLEGPMRAVPLLNIVLLTRDIFAGKATAGGAVLVVLSTLIYAAAAIALAARIFGAEAVLYNEQGSWADLFRRPIRERSTATVSSALFCLALMFPSQFVFFGVLAQYGNIPPVSDLALKALASLVLFGGFPLVSAWLRRVRLGTAFRLERAGLGAWGAAILFGLSLWPLADVVQNLLRDAGLATLNERWLGQSGGRLSSWRSVNPVVVVLCLAVIPAVLEELFFRGYLFSALCAASPLRTAVVVSALLFGLFHLVGPLLIVERGVTSTLLGLLLGWLAWRTGSVVPGMILHALHNTSLILLAYHDTSAWLDPSATRLPIQWVLASVTGCAVAVVWLFLTTGNRPAPAQDLVSPGEER